MQLGLLMFFCKFGRSLRSTSQLLAQRKNHRTMRIPDIPLRPLQIIGSGCLLQLVKQINRSILSFTAFRTPATVIDLVLNSPVQSCSIRTSLSVGDDFEVCSVHNLP